MTPLRLQRRRTKGWRLPPGAVCVTRPGPWGNPYVPGPAIRTETSSAPPLTAAGCVLLYRRALNQRLAPGRARRAAMITQLGELTGKHLCCWCQLCPDHANGKPFGEPCERCAPCHADVLGEFANSKLVCEPA